MALHESAVAAPETSGSVISLNTKRMLEAIEGLPEEEREVFDLLWYQGLTQAEAAGLLHVNVRTLKRRWLSARMKLQDALQGEVPE